MLQRALARLRPTSQPFLPLAFRLTASLGLMSLHLGIAEGLRPTPRGEWIYLTALLAFFMEALVEMEIRRRRTGSLLSAPAPTGVRWNLLLDLLLVSLVVAYQGVDMERFASLYLFPVLASAFFVGTLDILGTGLLATAMHAALVVGFAYGWLAPFGNSEPGMDTRRMVTVLGLTALQVLTATLVMTFLRRALERLRSDLQVSEATMGQLSDLHGRVVASMTSGLITLDLDRRITSANPAAEHILRQGIASGEVLERYLPIEEEQGSQTDRRFELELDTRDGPRILGGHLSPLLDGSGVPRGSLLLFQDLTDLKALEGRTRIAERLATVGGLAAGLAHELRNPLASVLGCIQLLRQGQQAETRERILGILQRESGRMNETLAHFLEFADPKDPRRETMDMARILEEVQNSWETDPRTEGVALAVQEPLPAFKVVGDPHLVHRIFTNLLSNARKAVGGADRPQVSIGWQLQGDRARVWVEDNGMGMDTDRLECLFIPFVSGFPEGSGLGMNLVFQGVQRLGWEVGVESEPGRGTRVTLELPVA